MHPTVRALVHEPVCHFLLLGVALFGVERAIRGSNEVPPSAERCALAFPEGPIVVDADVRRTLSDAWTRTHTGTPNAAELEALVDDHVEREVLYREGLLRGLAEGDARVRDRVAAQMAYVLEQSIVLTPPDDAQLRSWFEARAETFATPDRVDFTQVFVRGRDAAAEARAVELLQQLDGGATPDGMGDTYSGGRKFRGRKLVDLSERFGDAFAAGLRLQDAKTWSLLRSDDGLHLVRVDRWHPGDAPAFAEVRDQVRHDWEQAQRDGAREQAIAALGESWEVVLR